MTKNTKRSVCSTDKYIGQRICARRLQLGLSQNDLGEALEISFQQIQKYEKGVNRVSAATLIAIANVMEVEPAHFYQGAPGLSKKRGGEASEVDAFLATKDGLVIARALVRIADAEVRHVVAASVERLSHALAPKPRALQAAE
jgi:transcriptional regulator with XRE-family HTH domain